MKLAYIEAIAIHPDNNTYPIFSLNVQETSVDYMKKCDYSQIDVKIQNVQLFDNTQYPNTLDPSLQYGASDEIYRDQILGLDEKQVRQHGNMLDLTVVLFDFPNEDRCEA